MSYADTVFINMCKDILKNGTSTEGEKVRPKWPDGSSAYTIKRFGVVNRYDLTKEFPAITLRKTAIKSCTDEILWIWQRKSNNIHDLNSHIWDEWADETGSIGKAYGYQLSVRHKYKGITEEKLWIAFPSGEFVNTVRGRIYAKIVHGEVKNIYAQQVDGNIWEMDQVNKVIYDLRNTPYNRRVLTNIYTFSDLHEMTLYPCAYSMTFNVTAKPGREKLTLNAILNQRSQDVLAANNWNVCQYSVLLFMLAQVCGMEAGELVHVIADAHIYDRHIPIIEELIGRKTYDAPDFWLDPSIIDFYDFTKDSVKVSNYMAGEQIQNIPIAI